MTGVTMGRRLLTIEEFVTYMRDITLRNPTWFDLPPDRAPTADELRTQEVDLGAELPTAYLEFIEAFGGGDFAFLEIYSLDPSSRVNIVYRNSVSWLQRDDFIAFSDNVWGLLRLRSGQQAMP